MSIIVITLHETNCIVIAPANMKVLTLPKYSTNILLCGVQDDDDGDADGEGVRGMAGSLSSPNGPPLLTPISQVSTVFLFF